MKSVKSLLILAALSISLSSSADCIMISGLSFEKIDDNKLLAIRGGKNIAIISSHTSNYVSLPEKIGVFRFFSEKLCDYGAEDKFHIDGKLWIVDSIETYK